MKIEIKCPNCESRSFDESSILYIDDDLPSTEWSEFNYGRCASCDSLLVWRLVSGKKGILTFRRDPYVWDLCPETGTRIALRKCEKCECGNVISKEEDDEGSLVFFEVECEEGENSD